MLFEVSSFIRKNLMRKISGKYVNAIRHFFGPALCLVIGDKGFDKQILLTSLHVS